MHKRVYLSKLHTAKTVLHLRYITFSHLADFLANTFIKSDLYKWGHWEESKSAKEQYASAIKSLN